MELTPNIYHRLVRPKWVTKRYIHNLLSEHVSFHNKKVLDFGAGTGANCILCDSSHYVGVDPAEKRITFAKAYYPEYQFKVINNTLPLSDQSIDIILIIAVLHHIQPEAVPSFIKEFRRVLKGNQSKIVIIEPCFFNNTLASNWFMGTFDKGRHIGDEQQYISYFQDQGFVCNVVKKYSKCFLYNELFFTAVLEQV